MGIVIHNGEVVTASERFAADLRLENGTITQMATRLEPESGDETIDAAGISSCRVSSTRTCTWSWASWAPSAPTTSRWVPPRA